MTIRNLDALFKPKSIALIGASTTAGSLGALLVGNLSAAGFRGDVFPGIGLNASFAHRTAKDGMLAFVAQSGAIVTSVLDWADARGIGFFPSRLPRGHDRRGFRVDAILTLHCPTAS
jgi:acyl-CoA synthetase (NDP forming)